MLDVLLRSRTAVAVVALCAAGCASRPAAVATPAAAVTAGTIARLIEHGCYRCLEQAYDAAQSAGARPQAFEAATLLVLRSKELGIPHGTWQQRARELAGDDAAMAAYLDMIDVVPPDRLAEDRDVMFDVARRTRARASLPAWRATLEAGAGSDAFRTYLDVTLVCAFGSLKENADSFSGSVDPAVATPLVQYAIGACDATHAARLRAVRAGDEAFVDADFALGRYALEDPVAPDAEEALRRFRSAVEAFPESPAIAAQLGGLYRLWEDWTPALAAFDAALAVAPMHPEATIGRAVSLSYLERSPEAIETATRLIDGGQWHLGEAYYWRAWNHLRLKDYQAARADADRARTLMANAAVLVLSGVIEWRLGRLESAERDFEGALTVDLGECEAAFDLGVVRNQLGKPAQALAAFKQAGQCNDLSIAVRREAIAKIRSGPASEEQQAREAARHERLLVDLEERRGEIVEVIAATEKALPSAAVP